MLFQPSNIAPSTLSGIGAGTVDVTKGITVSWQVNGDTPMVAYQITIYQNDSASTQKYTTGKITLGSGSEFQPHDKNGNPQFFSTLITAANLSAAGIVNGYANGYKLKITQWWSPTDYVEQSSASVFITRADPTLTIDAIPSPVTSMSQTITATYNQAQDDPISTVEWVFALFGSESTPIKQTGTVTTQILSFDVDGLISGNTYSVECNVVTSSGVYVSTGFVQFSVSYNIPLEQITFTVGKARKSCAAYVSWSPMSSPSITSYSIYRQEDGIPYLLRVGTTDALNTEILDYSIGSQTRAKYIVTGMNGTTPVAVSDSSYYKPIFWDYSLLLCSTDADGVYHVQSEFRFSLDVETGSMSNNNAPALQINFTKYPTRQPISTLYKTGSLSGFIGSTNSAYDYTDSVALQNAIYEISTSRMTKFLKTRKGDVLMVDTSANISMKTEDDTVEQALKATIDWAEVGDASNASIVSVPTDSFWPL